MSDMSPEQAWDALCEAITTTCMPLFQAIYADLFFFWGFCLLAVVLISFQLTVPFVLVAVFGGGPLLLRLTLRSMRYRDTLVRQRRAQRIADLEAELRLGEPYDPYAVQQPHPALPLSGLLGVDASPCTTPQVSPRPQTTRMPVVESCSTVIQRTLTAHAEMRATAIVVSPDVSHMLLIDLPPIPTGMFLSGIADPVYGITIPLVVDAQATRTCRIDFADGSSVPVVIGNAIAPASIFDPITLE